MSMKLPPAWATNVNYATGPDTGAPTKVDPSSAANGFIRGVVAAPQHVNYLLDKQVAAGRRAFLLAACKLRRVALEGTSITDTAESLGAVQRLPGAPLIAIKTAQALGLGDADLFKVQGVPASITSLVVDAATNGTRIVVIGTGGNKCAYSDDDGVTWTAGGNVGNVPNAIVWNAVHGDFITTLSSFGEVKRSTAATSWSTSSSDAFTPGLAVLANGDTVYISGVVVRKSTDGGATWAGSFALPNSASFDEGGCLVGNAGAFAYHVARRASGSLMQVSSSGDGSTWSTLAVINAPTALGFASLPRIMMCQNTGLLVIAAPLTSTADALYASLDGVDWVGPSYVFPGPGINAYAVAGGRVLSTRDAMLFASDGVGY